jgi:hypothetical protein
MRLERDPMTPRDMLRIAMWVTLFWLGCALGSVIRHRDADYRNFLLIGNIWTAAMFLARYLSRTIR